MNKNKRKSHYGDVQIILGEPLPLPYKINKENPDVHEEEEDTAVDTKEFSEPIRRRFNQQINKYRQVSDIKDNTQLEGSFISLRKPRPLPVQEVPQLRRFLASDEIVSTEPLQKSQVSRQLDMIASIEEQIERLRKKVSSGDSLIDMDVLEDIEGRLTDISETKSKKDELKEEDPGKLSQSIAASSEELLHELEKLQNYNEKLLAASKPTLFEKFPISKVHVAIFVVVCFLLTSSFVVSGLNYEYCYYFC